MFLNERPHQTMLDWLVLSAEGVIAAEAKFTEKGFGTCSCERREQGVCDERVLARPYWDVADESLGLARGGSRCALSVAYQPVRNLAAARAIAGKRRHAFLLFYDERNPYFTGAGSWPGWLSVLRDSALSLSWQQLLNRVNVDTRVTEWAREKHGILSACGATPWM